MQGTTRVKDIALGVQDSTPNFLTNVNRTPFFTADHGSTGIELWKSDGSLEGTQMVQDFARGSADSNPAGLTLAGSKLFFYADDMHHGTELWMLNIHARTYLPRTAR